MAFLTKDKTKQVEQYIGKQIQTEESVSKVRVKGDLNQGGADMIKGALVSPIPKEAKRKSLSGKKTFSRKHVEDISRGDGDTPIQAAPVTEVVEQEAWTDATAEERTTSSVRYSNEIRDELYNMASQDIESEEFQKMSWIGQNVLTFIKEMYDTTSTTRASVESRDVVLPFLKELKEDLDNLRSTPEAKMEEAQKAFHEKYEDMSEQELSILSTYAPVILSDMKGNLDLDDKTVIDATDDNQFLSTKDIPLDKEISAKKGGKYDRKALIYNEHSDCTNVPLFSNEPSTYDIKQGNVGDCYALSGLNAIMQKDPNIIKDAMIDEGPTVTVRFFKEPDQPIYVRVKKTIPLVALRGKDVNGNPIEKAKEQIGARGRLWVSMFEKAYVIARPLLEPPEKVNEIKKKAEHPYDYIASGRSEDMVFHMTGKRMEKTRKLRGFYAHEELYVSTQDVFDSVHYAKKEEFKKSLKGKKHRGKNVEWNLYKAKEIFGIDLKETSGEVYDLFRKNSVFQAYEQAMKQYLETYFTTAAIEWYELRKKLGRVNEQVEEKPMHGFSSHEDVEVFLNTIQETDLPDIKIKGIDNETMKRKYLEYFKKTVHSSVYLRHKVNRTGKYDPIENQVFDEISKAVKDKKIIVTGTGVPTLSKKKGAGLNGEKTYLGIAGTHAYSVIDVATEKETINGEEVTHKFVILSNPWQSGIRMYDKNTGLPYKESDKRKDAESKGIFRMELSDYYNTFSDYSIEGEA